MFPEHHRSSSKTSFSASQSNSVGNMAICRHLFVPLCRRNTATTAFLRHPCSFHICCPTCKDWQRNMPNILSSSPLLVSTVNGKNFRENFSFANNVMICDVKISRQEDDLHVPTYEFAISQGFYVRETSELTVTINIIINIVIIIPGCTRRIGLHLKHNADIIKISDNFSFSGVWHAPLTTCRSSSRCRGLVCSM